MDNLIESIFSFKQSFFTLLVFGLIFFLTKKLLDRQASGKTDWGIIKSIVLFSIVLVGAIALILALPMPDDIRGQITSLIGIVISAVLALSSATFMGNALGGIMLRTINNFKPGDFIQVNDFFGRITERGLFHTEIQTENRDLTTLPNLYLATNPVKVTRASGTFIAGTVSLGYDVNRSKIEKSLLKAAKNAGLEDAFVRVTELGDFSVVYKVYGLVKEIKTVLSAQSRLNAYLLDALHEDGIEIVSPNFMNQRQVGETVFIPEKVRKSEETNQSDAPDSLIFDKADEAETIEKRKESLESVEQKIKEFQEQLKGSSEEDKEAINQKIEKWKDIKQKMLDKLNEKVIEISTKK